MAVVSIIGSSPDGDESPGPRGGPVQISPSLTSTGFPRSSWKAGCLVPPVPGPIVRFFQEPDCPYCAGQRTVDFGVRFGDVIRSPVAGRVSFAGFVAGVGYVTVVPVADPTHLVTLGGVIPGAMPETIAAGDHIGTAQGPEVVRLSVRQIRASGPKAYRDPEPLLARWRVRARLVDPHEDEARSGDPRSGDDGSGTAGSRRPGRAEYGCRPPGPAADSSGTSPGLSPVTPSGDRAGRHGVDGASGAGSR